MRSFDPDDEHPYVEPDEAAGIELDADLVAVDADRALSLLDQIAASLPGGGEVRPGQRTMVRLVAEAVSRRRHLIVEAGTGVGKSLAYLIPAAMSGRRVVVATATKNLQDQLASKDAPTVAAALAGVRVAVLKGRSNYFCRNRAHDMGATQLHFDDDTAVPAGVVNQIRRVLRWSNETTTGDLDELSFDLDPRTRRAVTVTPQECLGRAQCPQGNACFAELARDRAAASSIVITNSHFYASHLASGSMLLPDHDIVVFDEAHEVLDIFAELLGTSLAPTRLRTVAGALRPLLGANDRAMTNELVSLADRLSSSLQRQVSVGQLTGVDETTQNILERTGEVLTMVVGAVRTLSAVDATFEFRRKRALGPAVHLANDIQRLRTVGADELLYLTSRDREVRLELALIEVGARLESLLWNEVTGVLTSATIPDSLASSLGLPHVPVERVPSPFDYANHALLYVPPAFPHRNHDDAEARITDELVELVQAAGGRTLALFTNRSVMDRVAAAVSPRLTTPVLVQGTLSRQRIIENFRDHAEASLFAVTSFWQGIDVPGHSLSLVTIDRLPFAVPTDPLAVARRQRSDRPFFNVDLPRAAMLLAQGVGRLIRSAEDRGVVAVLDTRLAEAPYRSQLFRRLPPMRRTRDRATVLAFLRDLRAEDHADQPRSTVD